MELDALDNSRSVTAPKIEDHPLCCQDYGTEVCGSSNGLICLSNSLDTLAVWNFSTRKSRKLPYAPIEFKDLNRYLDSRIYGFGYDKISDDYKVVRIVVLKGKDGNVFDNEVKVYSLKSHSWHRVQKFPKCSNLKRIKGVLAGGCLHWYVPEGFSERKGRKIVTFDLDKEVFGSVEQPEYTEMGFYMQLQTLGECLSITCNYYSDHVNIWVMKEYGVKESWTMLVSIMQMGLVRPFQYMYPITYSKSGRELLLDQGADKLVWYDMEKKTMRFVKVRGEKALWQVDVCVESLIPLDVVDCGEKKKEKEERNMDNFLSKGFKLVL